VNRKTPDENALGALELIEECVHLLRLAPLGVLASYYVGTLPFALGMLFFWAEMGQSAFAYDRCAASALMVGSLFLWMKTWQSIFACQLRAQIVGEPPPRWTFRRLSCVAVTQIFIQPSGLFIVPAAFALMLPFGWAYAFYQTITALGHQDPVSIRGTLRSALAQAALWPRQNHVLLVILAGFGLFVFLNWMLALFWVPLLVKILFGIETIFVRNPQTALNSTSLAAMGMLTYISLDPLVKVVYVLRSFYGQSLQSGEDLRAELKRFILPARLAALAALSLILFGAESVVAADGGKPINSELDSREPKLETRGLSPSDLDRALERVVNQREYTWRFPRERILRDELQKNMLVRFMEQVAGTLREIRRTLRSWWERVRDWWDRIWGNSDWDSGQRSGFSWRGSQLLLFALLTAVAGALAIFLWRVWRRRQKKSEEVVTEALAVRLDLAGDNVVADQLPEDSWLKLAGELIDQGDLRLGLRALYLASLAHLARREIIRIAKHKSNREYETELCRRARGMSGLPQAFSENVGLFDCAWYGMHEVTHDVLNQFRANLERIRAC
jgi:hypothetical protein